MRGKPLVDEENLIEVQPRDGSLALAEIDVGVELFEQVRDPRIALLVKPIGELLLDLQGIVAPGPELFRAVGDGFLEDFLGGQSDDEALQSG